MIALYKGISSISQTIQWFHRSEYSHAAWHEPDGSGWEAWARGGVQRFDHFRDTHSPGTIIHCFQVDMSSAQHDCLQNFLRSQEGKGYDFLSVIRFITRRPQRPVDQDRWFCSELIFAAFQYIGMPLLMRIPAWKVYPEMLAYSPLLVPAGTIVT